MIWFFSAKISISALEGSSIPILFKFEDLTVGLVESHAGSLACPNLPLKKSIIIPNGLDPKEFGQKSIEGNKINFREKFGIGADKKIVLSLGRINWKKGFDTLIPAFSEVMKEEPKAVLIIAGEDDGYKKQLELLISNRQLQQNVIFTGLLLDEERIAAYHEAQVFVLPSYSENFGMAVVEAMHFSLPVVITEGVGISKEVMNAKAGLVVQKNTKELSEGLIKILTDEKLRKELGENAKNFAKNRLSAEKIAEEFTKVYSEFIQLGY